MQKKIDKPSSKNNKNKLNIIDQQLLKLDFSDDITPDNYVSNIPPNSKIVGPYPLFRASGFRPSKGLLDEPNFQKKILHSTKDGKYFAVSGNPNLPTLKARDYLMPLLVYAKPSNNIHGYCVEMSFESYFSALGSEKLIKNTSENRYFVCNTLATLGLNFETNLFSHNLTDVIFFPLITSVEMRSKSFRVYFNSRYIDIQKLLCSTPRLIHYNNFKSSVAKTLYLSLVTRLNDNYAFRDAEDKIKQINFWYYTLQELIVLCNFDHWLKLEGKYLNRKVNTILLSGIKELIGTNSDNNYYNCFLTRTNPKTNPYFDKVDSIVNTDLVDLEKADPCDIHTFYVFTRGHKILQDFPFDERKISRDIS